MNAVSDFHPDEGIMCMAKVLQATYFWLLIPVISSWILDEWFGVFKRQVRAAILGKKTQILITTIPTGAYHIYFFEKYSFETHDGKVHMLATLYLALFLVMIFFDFRADLDINIKLGIMVSYLGIGISFLSLVVQSIYGEAEIITFLFRGGLASYFMGLAIISYYVNFNQLRMFRNRA